MPKSIKKPDIQIYKEKNIYKIKVIENVKSQNRNKITIYTRREVSNFSLSWTIGPSRIFQTKASENLTRSLH